MTRVMMLVACVSVSMFVVGARAEMRSIITNTARAWRIPTAGGAGTIRTRRVGTET